MSRCFIRFVAVLAVLACMTAAALAGQPLPTDYPEQFIIQFQSNITSVALPEGMNPDHFPTDNLMYYDWSKQMQRVDHGAGSYECTKFYESDLPCTIWFTPSGLFRKLEEPLPEGQPEW